MPVLVTGATGFIASRLIPRLLEKGHAVRCLARDPERLSRRAWREQVEIVQGDLTQPATLPAAMKGVSTAYYLVHSMASGNQYYQRDLDAAANFSCAARDNGLEHIIYLGGLADPEAKIAPHMRSRILTGEYLRTCGLPVTEFRAGVIVGPGSISFEMIRFLCEHLPVLVGPDWLKNRSQPIAVQNVLDYLLAALEQQSVRGGIYEIGGPDVLTYAGTMQVFARLRGLKRPVFFVPGIPVDFMAWWVDKLTPVPKPIANPLIEGLMSDSVVRDDAARRTFPDVDLLGYEEAVQMALTQLTPTHLEPTWNDTAGTAGQVKHEGFFVEHRSVPVQTAPRTVFSVLTEMGGRRGWPFANGLWQMRGWIDTLLGGAGLRGRSHQEGLHPGDTLDYYRVEVMEIDYHLRLACELKAPGGNWIEWRIEPAENGCLLSQTVYFTPHGLAGCLYWYLLMPVHSWVFHGLIDAIIRRAEQHRCQ